MNFRPAGMSSDESDTDFDYGGEDLKQERQRVQVPEPPRPVPVTQSVRVNRELNATVQRERNLADFHRAVEDEDLEAVEELLRLGVPVDGTFPGEWTPLMKACSKGNAVMVEYLLQNRANPNLHKELQTPVMACCIASYTDEHSRAECLNLLLQYGANHNSKDKHKSTALMNAAANGLLELVNILLHAPNLDINAQDKEGWTALFHAVNNNHIAIAERLLHAGVDTSIKECRHDMTAAGIAEAKNLKELAEILGCSDFTTQQEPIVYQTPDPVNDFLSEIPDRFGNGGFSSDVKYILSGLGLVNLQYRLNKSFSLPEFLNISDKELFDAGVKFAPTRRKILRGVHKFHCQPWGKGSMHQMNQEGQFQLEDVIYIVSSIVKHLTIMNASLRYLKSRIAITLEEKHEDLIDCKLIESLIETHKEINQFKQTLRKLLAQINQIKIVGTVQADHVGPEDFKKLEKKRKSKFICPVVCSVVIGGLIYCVKFILR